MGRVKMGTQWGKLLLFAGLSNLSCASDDERPPSTDIGSSPTGHVIGGDSYPEGPYGVANPEVGEVVQDLTLLGYFGDGQLVQPSRDLEESSFSDLRDGDARYLLIHVSSLWCATCRPEAVSMSEYTGQIVEAGGAVLEILIDGEVLGLDPTQEELDVWVLNNDLRMTTLIPGDENVRRVFPDRDFVYIIDMSTMEVVWREEGPGQDGATTEIGAQEMLAHYLSE